MNDAHDDIFALLNIHHHAGGSSSAAARADRIINSDSHDNYSPKSSQGDGQNADRFSVHYQETGAVTTSAAAAPGGTPTTAGTNLQEVPVITDSSWSIGDGFSNSGMNRPADGNPNGFKIGSSKTGIRHVVRELRRVADRAAGVLTRTTRWVATTGSTTRRT